MGLTLSARSMALVLSTWSFVGCLFAARFLITFGYSGSPATGTEALTRGLLDAWLWAALTPAVLRLSHRFPLRPLRWIRILVHISAGLGIASVQLVAYQALVDRLAWLPARADDPRDLIENLLTYAVVLAVGQYLVLQQDARARDVRAVKLETQLSDARLALLRSQLRPHFLFNALHTVSELLYDEPDRAETLLVDIGDLLRASLQHEDPHLITVQAELALVEKYLSICNARHAGRVKPHVSSDAQTGAQMVPAFLLQPLVENAFRHGVEPATGRRTVVVSARTARGQVCLRVEDDGVGYGDADRRSDGTGRGLRLVQERLEWLYGNRATVSVTPGPEGGTVAEVHLPAGQTESL